MEVHLARDQFFVNPSADSVWIRNLDTHAGRVVAEGRAAPPDSAQFQGGRATCDGSDLLVVFPIQRGPSREERAQVVSLLRKHIGSAAVAFVIEDGIGRAVVETPGDEPEPPRAAAAVAVFKASWGWDESPTFDIEVNGVTYSVAAHVEDRIWTARVQRHPSRVRMAAPELPAPRSATGRASPATFTVADCFRIRGRGVVLAPSLPIDRFPSGARLSVEVRGPDGAVQTHAGHFLIEHLRLSGGGSEWGGVVVLNESAPVVPAGSTVEVSLVDDDR